MAFGPAEIGTLIPIVALSIPIVAIWTAHQRKMLELRLRLKGEVPQELKAELDELKAQLGQLRDTTTKFDMSFDAAITRLEDRMDRVEGRAYGSASDEVPAVAPSVATRPTTEEAPPVLTVGQGRFGGV